MRNRLIIALLALTWLPFASAEDWKVGEPIVTY